MWTFLMGVLLKKENLYCLRLRKKYSPIHACMQKVGMQEQILVFTVLADSNMQINTYISLTVAVQ